MIKTAVVGATGYAGEELVRLLVSHPQVELAHVISKSFAKMAMGEVYGSYKSLPEMTLEELEPSALSECDVVFTALPHGQSMSIVPALLQAGVKVIDLSGDFRYDDVKVYEKWYKLPHSEPEINKNAVYGLCELHRGDIKATNIVANPGCYTTTSILPLYPLLTAGIISDKGIVVDAKSGVTGAGRSEKLANSYCEVNESMKAYGVTTHRHTSEIEQELSHAAREQVALSFTPHLLPVKRGILATIYTTLNDGVTEAQIAKAYSCYDSETFVHVLPHGELPELKHVTGSNNCFIGYKIDERLGRLIIVSCIDNLIKGAAGQAVQNMNILMGLPEDTGLPKLAMYL